MKTQRVSAILMVFVGMFLAACMPANIETDISTNDTTAVPSETLTQAPVGEVVPSKDVENGTYLIEGQPITLVNGVAENEVMPGSASKQITSYFGNEVEVDLNSDGVMDMAFLLQQENGGSGIFFYVAAAVQTADGYLGTNAIFLGDRIAPQSTNIDLKDPSRFVVNYVDRKEGEPMSSPPTEGVSKTFKFENGSLAEVTE